MLTVDRGGDVLKQEERTGRRGEEMIHYHITSPKKKRKISKGCESSDQDADIFYLRTEDVPPSMVQCVVSLILFDGDMSVLSCSGIPIKSKLPSVTRLLTSEILGITFISKRNAGHVMKIEVRDAFNNHATGWLEEHYLLPGITLVNTTEFLDVRAVRLDHEVQILPESSVVGIELNVSGAAKLVKGVVIKDSSDSEDAIKPSYSTCNSEDAIKPSYSTCKISKAGDGGPLFDGDGNFVGMNLFLDREEGAFMQRSVVTEKLQQFEKMIEVISSRSTRSTRRICTPEALRRSKRSIYYLGNELTAQELLEEDLDSLGYPKPSKTTVDCGMILINTFEDMFGDTYESREGVWSLLSGTVSENLSETVVALASFSGKMRVFACSGIIIDWNGSTAILTSASLVRNCRDENKIGDNLRIDVLLPNKRHTEGTLEYFNLHYNIAIVNMKDFYYLPKARICDQGALISDQVVSVGRCFESGMLMATRGYLTRGHWYSLLDCRSLLYSSCEITKAGIGGPIVDFEGKFVGMNFYDENAGTPFLPQAMIVRFLQDIKQKRMIREVDDDGLTNRWPVPKPVWRCPDKHQNEDKELRLDEDKEFLLFGWD
ncbi:hypothetical protein ACP4OV_020864 [Aristida adscensionis]